MADSEPARAGAVITISDDGENLNVELRFERPFGSRDHESISTVAEAAAMKALEAITQFIEELNEGEG